MPSSLQVSIIDDIARETIIYSIKLFNKKSLFQPDDIEHFNFLLDSSGIASSNEDIPIAATGTPVGKANPYKP